ncbi:hypothetical protein chiPu_0019425 [Chiloscyllium punctatum]|uniref:Uncharacterized protein n=1 Tax=Chiloscyllium punctatum TaxID=137246 RepID=A0A401RRU4_CHIPU|nr:hypothetical protein [Chiloscyllium punctatum]
MLQRLCIIYEALKACKAKWCYDQLSRKVSKLSADVGVQTKQLKSTSDTSIHRERSDAIVQTKETRLPTFESDKDHVQQSRALLNDASTQTMESGGKEIEQSDASIQTEMQIPQLDSDEQTFQEQQHEPGLENNLQMDLCKLSNTESGIII